MRNTPRIHQIFSNARAEKLAPLGDISHLTARADLEKWDPFFPNAVESREVCLHHIGLIPSAFPKFSLLSTRREDLAQSDPSEPLNLPSVPPVRENELARIIRERETMKINFILSHPRGREEFEAFQRELENGTLKIQDFRAEIGKYPNKINYKRRTEQLILGLTEVTNGLRQGQSARDIWEFSSFDEWIFCDNYNLKRGEREFLSDWEEDQSLWNYRLEKGADIVFALWLRTPILDGILAKLKKEIQRESEESEKRAASPLALKRLDFWEKELRRVELGEGKNQEDIIEFLGLMDSIINSFTQKLLYDLNSHDYEDFFQEARISSLKAIRHYDPPFDANFVTIAFFWILATAKRFRDNQNRAIKLSQNGQKLFREFEKNAASHKSPLGETPFSWEIAQELMISLGDIAENENGNMSEEASFSGLENERDDFISSLAAPTIDIERELDAEKMRAQFGENFWRALSKLPDERMIQIIILRFGFLGEKIPTLKMVGDLFGRTAQWAKKVERQALNLLRDNADMDCLKIFLD